MATLFVQKQFRDELNKVKASDLDNPDVFKSFNSLYKGETIKDSKQLRKILDKYQIRYNIYWDNYGDNYNPYFELLIPDQQTINSYRDMAVKKGQCSKNFYSNEDHRFLLEMGFTAKQTRRIMRVLNNRNKSNDLSEVRFDNGYYQEQGNIKQAESNIDWLVGKEFQPRNFLQRIKEFFQFWKKKQNTFSETGEPIVKEKHIYDGDFVFLDYATRFIPCILDTDGYLIVPAITINCFALPIKPKYWFENQELIEATGDLVSPNEMLTRKGKQREIIFNGDFLTVAYLSDDFNLYPERFNGHKISLTKGE